MDTSNPVPWNATQVNTFETLVANERTNLLRFCTHLTSSSQAAEDLTQETLLTAWRRRDSITDSAGLSHWLKAIARNIFRNWQRSKSRQRQYLFPCDLHASQNENEPFDAADDFDLDIELERNDLITLLDRAMDLLPAETRGLLVQHYIEELPHAELAAQVGLSTGAVGVRLHRGKLALRKALVTDFREDAIAFGLVSLEDAMWTDTRMWCVHCGQHRIQGHFDHAKNFLHLRCPSCAQSSEQAGTITYSYNDSLHEVKAFKPAFMRILKWSYTYHFRYEAARLVPCYRCGEFVPLRVGPPPWEPSFHNAIYDWCDRCGVGCEANDWSSRALCLPQVRQFWKDHPRMMTLPERSVEVAGSPAALVGFASVVGDAKIEIAFSKNTFGVVYES